MFTALANAIAFEVAFRTAYWYASSAHDVVSTEAKVLRGNFICSEFEELRTNSGLPVGTRAITAEFLGEAVAYKTQAKLDAADARNDEWHIVYDRTNARPSHLTKTVYTRRAAAFAAVKKLNDRYNGGYAVRTPAERILKRRLRLVQNLLSKQPVLEPVGTPNYCSVASEAYWSA